MALKVGELTSRDEFGRGIVRIDNKIMKELGIREGDVIELQGQKKTAAIAVRSYPADIGLKIIRMDKSSQILVIARSQGQHYLIGSLPDQPPLHRSLSFPARRGNLWLGRRIWHPAGKKE